MTQDKQWTREAIEAVLIQCCTGIDPLAALKANGLTIVPVAGDVGENGPNLGRANSYEAGQLLFNAFRTFLGSAGIDSSQCNFVIELPDRDAQRRLVGRLQQDARAAPSMSAARAGNHSGTWQGVPYEFSVKGWRATPAAQGPSPMDHWKRARVDPPAVAGLVEAATAARRFLWAKSNATEYRNLANQLSTALAAYDKEQG